MTSKQRRAAAMRKTRVSANLIPPLAGTVIRKGRAPQQVGLYGRTSMYYKTSATIDKRWDNTAWAHPA